MDGPRGTKANHCRKRNFCPQDTLVTTFHPYLQLTPIRTTLGAGERHRDSQYLNNRLERDHRGVKGRYGPMRGFKRPRSAGEFCRAYDELRNSLRSRSRTNQQVSADYRRFHFLRRTATVLRVMEAA
jgi:putative transposase